MADIRKVAQEAVEVRALSGRRTVLFIDEIHRFTRVQQDALLPDVERGAITLIGASTQNPFFAIIPALSSRSQIFEFKPLGREHVRSLILRALADKERGLGNRPVTLTEDALELIIAQSNGDARRALNALELGVLSTPAGPMARFFTTSLRPRSRSRKRRWHTMRTSITTPFPPSSRACAAAIPMRRSTGWPK